MLNDYNKVGKIYRKSHSKLDKYFSHLPTILAFAKQIKSKTVIDVGCGDGFYSYYFSKRARKVYGIDNSVQQLKKARAKNIRKAKFILGNILTVKLPKSDLINSPYVLGYFKTQKELTKLFTNFYNSLNKNGKVVGLVDAPRGLIHNNKEFGSIKIIKGKRLEEGVKMDIELYSNQEKIITLHAYYHTKNVIENALKKSGFLKIKWYKPVVSKEGINIYGKRFWSKYLRNCDVAYFIAIK